MDVTDVTHLNRCVRVVRDLLRPLTLTDAVRRRRNVTPRVEYAKYFGFYGPLCSVPPPPPPPLRASTFGEEGSEVRRRLTVLSTGESGTTNVPRGVSMLLVLVRIRVGTFVFVSTLSGLRPPNPPGVITYLH